MGYPIGKVLYQTGGWLSHPRVSPKGDVVAFIEHPVRRDDAGSIAVVDLSGKKKTLSTGWETAWGLGWSPNGTEIWFSSTRLGYGRYLSAGKPGGQGAASRTGARHTDPPGWSQGRARAD